MKIEIKNGIPDHIALYCVLKVVEGGKVSNGHKRKYYCWATAFDTPVGEVMVYVRNYRKTDCFMVYKIGEYGKESK